MGVYDLFFRMDSSVFNPVLADLIGGTKEQWLWILTVIGLILGSAVLGIIFVIYMLIKWLFPSKNPPELPKPSKPPELPKLSKPPELPKTLEPSMPLESPKPSKLYKMPELPDRLEDGLEIQPASIIHSAKKTMQRIFLHLGYGVFGMAAIFFVFCGMVSFFYLQEPESQDSLLVEIAASLLLLFLGLFFYRIHRWINRRMIAPHASDSPETGKQLEPPELPEGELANQSKGT